MKTFKLFLLLAATFVASLMVSGAPIIQDNKPWSMLQLSIVPDAVAFTPSDIPVLGVNIEPFYGAQQRVGIINFQPLVGTTDVTKGVIYQGLGFNGETVGLQLGVATFQRYFIGLNAAVVTGARENHGLQVGLVNLSGAAAPAMGADEDTPVPAARGVQIGLFNGTTNGFQFGLLNYNSESVIPLMILFNYSAR
ncbi:MAG: hypothetical protein HPZ91_01385 [Lentisphaeria bacterium]|nr:hypothetical protein [Lentisphaeria bacterium]